MQYGALGAGAVLLVAGAIGGCGGAAAETETTTVETSHDERPVEHDDGSQITGLMGTIRQDQVRDTMELRMDAFMHCFEQRLPAVHFLGGAITLSFRIRTDGTVLWVYPSRSTLGDRAVETCATEVASRAHFPHPHGGEAEFSWGFELDPPSDVRAPVSLASGGIDALIASSGTAVRGQCGPGRYDVTAYVSPGGSPLAVGVATDSSDAGAHLDCVATAISAWTFPDPGSYAGKVSFSL
jgi:hypothetical protein